MKINILKTEKELKHWRKTQQAEVIFVPTMGGLHKGHGELIKTARALDISKSSSVIVSVFINPLQFGASEDFAQYPRDLKADIDFADKFGADVLWSPTIDDVFSGGIEQHFKLEAPENLKSNLCGKTRKGHFDGVATVLVRLLTLVRPTVLILGEKDWQQLIIVRQLIKELNLPVKLKGVPTVRDNDGLAYSSRNKFLSQIEREKAISLPIILKNAAKNSIEGKKPSVEKIKLDLEKSNLKVDYVEIVDPYLLKPVENCQKLTLLAASVRSGKTRLIDHRFIMNRKKPIIAIDGPAGAGKSTVTRSLAKKLGLIYLDTGAMYRAVTWLIKKEKIDLEKDKEICNLLKEIKLEINIAPDGNQTITINNFNVTKKIRSPEITSLVSKIASNINVRKSLTKQQKSFGLKGGIVAEGRDIGSVVFPDAELKIFLTASSSERALRRAKDLQDKGYEVPNLKELESQIIERDFLDSNRSISPLIKADDAIELITDGMGIEEVITHIVELCSQNIPSEVLSLPII